MLGYVVSTARLDSHSKEGRIPWPPGYVDVALGSRFSGGPGSVRFTVNLDDLKGLFQGEQFYNSAM